MQKHPSDEELIQYQLRRGGETDARSAAHLQSGCATCERTLKELQAILAFVSVPGLTEAPAPVLGRALAWLEQREFSRTSENQARSVRRENVGSAARRAASITAKSVGRKVDQAAAEVERALEGILAVLVFDTAVGALLPGIRGAATASGRQLMFESAAGELQLQLEHTARGRIELYGQFLPRTADAALETGRVVLTQRGKESVRRLSPTGEFRFAGVAPLETELRVEWNGIRIRTGPLPPTPERDG
jgi:hypothetical protein